MKIYTKMLLSIALLVGGGAFAQTTVTFWHSMEGAETSIGELVAAFNQSQDEYTVVAEYVGGYPEAQTRLAAAFGTQAAPVMFQAEVGYWPQLVADGALHDLSDLMAELEPGFLADFYPGLLAYGEIDGGRYGLPWNSSTPVMYVNQDALDQAGVPVPTDWESFMAAARQLTTRQAQGAAFVGDSWLFEMIVLSMGGRIVLDDGTPNFDSAEALEALTMLRDLQADGSLAYYSNTESTAAILTFVRTRALMTFASIANWPDVRRFSIGFQIAARPVPSNDDGVVPLGGAQLTILRTASEEQRRGAFTFWQFLMEPDNLRIWVEDSFYIPVRRAALPLLEDFYDEDPNRAAALSQLEMAIARPRVPQVNAWRTMIDDTLELVMRGGQDPARALEDLQQRALGDI